MASAANAAVGRPLLVVYVTFPEDGSNSKLTEKVFSQQKLVKSIGHNSTVTVHELSVAIAHCILANSLPLSIQEL